MTPLAAQDRDLGLALSARPTSLLAFVRRAAAGSRSGDPVAAIADHLQKFWDPRMRIR